ncbi:hypothetical protein QTP88_010990 [Uroleucon formosanum]
MSSDEEDVAIPILWFLLREIEQEENKKKLWVHPLNLKRTENNTIKCFIHELRNDECKFRNFTRMSTDTFDYILEILNDEIRKPDTNFRKSITPEEKLLDYKVSIEHEMNIEHLISLVQERQCLYDYKHKNYSNRNIQEQLWTEISDILKIPANECKAKWTTLRNSFSRQQNKMLSGSGASSRKRKCLYDIDNLENDSFVEEPIVPDAEQNLETVEQEVISQTIVDEDAENEKSSNKPLFKKPRTNRKMLPSERVVEPMLEFLKTRTQPKKNNEDTPELSFFKSIIPDFLKLNDKNQRQFKKIVLNTIDQVLDSQETSYEMPRYNNAPHSNIIPHLSPDQQLNANQQPQQFNAIQYIASSPDFSSSDSSSSYILP